MTDFTKWIRDVPDFPKPGIIFKDITPLLQDPEAFRAAVDAMDERFADSPYDRIVGIDSRGFIFGAALAYKRGISFVPVRKPGKLPHETDTVSYDLEYGSDSIEIHKDALDAGDRVLIVDDLMATGGTVEATAKLVKKLGGKIVGYAFLIELSFLEGRKRLDEGRIESLITY